MVYYYKEYQRCVVLADNKFCRACGNRRITAAMYFGSVKFFKHLIYTVIVLVIAFIIGCTAVFGFKYYNLKKENKELVQDVMSSEWRTNSTTLEEYYLHMASDGYTAKDIFDFLSENEVEATNDFAEKYIAENPDKFAPTAEDTGSEAGTTANEYTLLYPELYAEPAKEFTEKENTVYLTFDDGPSENTLDILYILNKYDIKATFFMSGGESERSKEIMKAVADAGHTIGIHSISHEYDEIYQSVESFLEDMNNTYESVCSATGVKPQIIRFAGGSINNYNRLIYPQLIAEVTRRGFTYYDWNVSGEDATTHATWTSIYNNVLNGIENNSSGRAIVLLHDSADKQLTVNTVEDIIIALRKDGYSFDKLDSSVKPITFSYVD